MKTEAPTDGDIQDAWDKANLREACDIVEAMARRVGKDCEIIFADDFVQVAPLGDPGYTAGATLYLALRKSVDASQSHPEPTE
jgi:hypothetical protein